MSSRIPSDRATSRARSVPDELLVRVDDGGRTVAFQWTDGAGELQYWVLSPEQSSAFLATASDPSAAG